MKNYRTLDAIVVVIALVELGFIFWALVFLTIPQANLPILAGLVGSTIGGMLGLYAGARWGNKKTDEPHTPGDVSVSLSATSTPAAAPDADA